MATFTNTSENLDIIIIQPELGGKIFNTDTKNLLERRQKRPGLEEGTYSDFHVGRKFPRKEMLRKFLLKIQS